MLPLFFIPRFLGGKTIIIQPIRGEKCENAAENITRGQQEEMKNSTACVEYCKKLLDVPKIQHRSGSLHTRRRFRFV